MGEIEDLRERMNAQGQAIKRLQSENDQLRASNQVMEMEKKQWLVEKAMQQQIIQQQLAAKDAEMAAVSAELIALKEERRDH